LPRFALKQADDLDLDLDLDLGQLWLWLMPCAVHFPVLSSRESRFGPPIAVFSVLNAAAARGLGTGSQQKKRKSTAYHHTPHFHMHADAFWLWR